MGSVQLLVPQGVAPAELPWPLFDAISRALMFLGFEEMPVKDQPPKNIWLDSEKLTTHFANLRRDREASDIPGVDGPIDDPVQNELTKNFPIR